jgi:exoribonuclease R
VLDALPGLPATMSESGRRAATFERACVDLVEATLLAGREGRTFDAVVVDVDERSDTDGRPERGLVVLREPAVRARVEGTGLPLGERVKVKLAEADVARRSVLFHIA